MDSGGTAVGQKPLIEREEELAAIADALASARDRTGTLLLVEGPAGIGKTSLLREGRRIAGSDGMTVLHGTGTEFEREYPFGVLRQALSHLILDESERERRLKGAAGLAEQALIDTGEEVAASPFGLFNGLYWFIAGLADESPVLLCIDDAHWADEPSLRFLGFLARRLDSIRVALLVGARTEADFSSPPPALLGVRDHARAHGARVEPGALDQKGVAEVLSGVKGGDVGEAMAGACHRATGGNPFLLDELARALRDRDFDLGPAEAGRVADLSPPGLTTSVNATLERLGPDAAGLARAAGILGEGAALELAAELARLDSVAASAAAVDLVQAGILERGAELRFRHPILAGAVRDGLSVHDRAVGHARAAEVLRGRGAPPERVALQLPHVLPAGDARVVSELRVAARHARERGAPATAAMLLARALTEPPDADDRTEILMELGRAEMDEGALSEASEHFYEAHQGASDPLTRGRAAALMSLAVPGDQAARKRLGTVIKATLGEVEPLDRELALRLRSILTLEGAPADDSALNGETVAEAVFLGTLVFARMDSTARAEDIVSLATRGARQADALLDEGAIALAFTGIVLGLRWTDHLDEAERLVDRAIDVSRRRGSISDFGMAMTLRANIHRRAGRLREAEADARAALPASLDDRWLFARGVQPLALSLLDQGRPEEASGEMSAVLRSGEELPDSPPMIPVVLTRMAVRAGLRDHEGALADWEDALRRVDGMGRGVNAGWIEDLAVAASVHHALGDSESAREVATQARELAETWGTPGAIGEAVLTEVEVGAVDDAEEALRQAVALMSGTPVRLVYAKALAALGGLLRRQGRRVDCREPLREAYDIAMECGAGGLAESVRTELRASGIRVKREVQSGADSLTPSERRIADMAAEGLTNAEIAQELFLTVKTVEMHLTQSYRKLDIRGRRDLSQALNSQV